MSSVTSSVMCFFTDLTTNFSSVVLRELLHRPLIFAGTGVLKIDSLVTVLGRPTHAPRIQSWYSAVPGSTSHLL